MKSAILWPGLALGVSLMAQAQPGPTKVGVIQIQSAIVSTKDGQKAAADLEARLSPRRKELERRQNELRDMQDKLQKGGNAMNETAKNDLVRSIDQKTRGFNHDMQDAQAEADEEQQKVLNELGQKMMAVIDKYAKDNGYSVILDVSNPNTPVLYASTAIDITKEIIDLYDKNSPTTMPTSGAPPASFPKSMTTPAPKSTTPLSPPPVLPKKPPTPGVK